MQVEGLKTLDRLRLSRRISDDNLAARRESVFRLIAEMTVVDVSGPVLDRASQPYPRPSALWTPSIWGQPSPGGRERRPIW